MGGIFTKLQKIFYRKTYQRLQSSVEDTPELTNEEIERTQEIKKILVSDELTSSDK